VRHLPILSHEIELFFVTGQHMSAKFIYIFPHDQFCQQETRKDVQGAAFNVTHFESRITHLLYTAINTTEHG